MFTNEFYYSKTETTYEAPKKKRQIPVNRDAQKENKEKLPVVPPVSDPVPAPEKPRQETHQPSPAPEVTKRETLLAEENVRVNAEFANYRKRVERDKEAVKTQALETALERLFPVLDDISFARQYGDLQDGPFGAIASKLEATLSGMGLTRIAEVGVEFNPEIHEALIRQPHAEIPEDHVSQILRDGWRSETRVLRAAQVAVSAG